MLQANWMSKIDAKSVLLLLLSAVLISASVIMLKHTQAAPISLSGTCGGVFNLRTAADGELQNGDQVSINAGTYINFTNNKISFSLTDQTAGQNSVTFAQKAFTNKSFTLIADPELADAYEMTIPADDRLNAPITVRLIPVNSGNTILIQGKTLGATGMCQKV